jgi:hypothetical protein
VGLAVAAAFPRHQGLSQRISASTTSNPYRHIRGFNYQPSWSSNGFAIWRQFKQEDFHRELGQGKKYFPGINTIRLWLSFDAYAGADAAVQKTVAANFQTALQIADSYHLKVIPVLFNNWHSVPDFGGIANEMIEYWMNDHDRNHTIPVNVFISYYATNPSTAELRPRSRSGLHPFTANAKN